MLYIHTVYTKWKPEFGAPPLPDFVMGPLLLLKSVWQPTKVEPFNLKTKERGHQHSTKCLQKLCVISQLAYVCPWWHIHSVMVELPFAFEVIEILFPGWRKIFGRQSWGRMQRSLCCLLKAICCLEILQAPYRCQQLSTPFWSTVCHKKQAIYEKQTREQMREQENIERHQPLVLNWVTLQGCSNWIATVINYTMITVFLVQ